MSSVKASSLQVLADSMGVPKLSDEAAKALAPDLEYRMRDIIQEAIKFQRHSKRTALTTDDISQALRKRNATPVYGFASPGDADKGAARFLRVAGHLDLFFLEDRVVSVDKLITRPLPRAPVEVGIVPHWLVVDGVQPAIPENAAIGSLNRRHKRLRTGAAPSAQGVGLDGATGRHADKERPKKDTTATNSAATGAATGEAAGVRAPVKHVLSQELQLYLDRVSLVLTSTEELQRAGPAVAASVTGSADGGAVIPPQPAPGQLLQGVLASLASDPGLQPVVPYLVQSIGEGVVTGLRDLPRLLRLLSAIKVLAGNPALDLVPYLHQLLPAVLTCLVAKRLGERGDSGHWEVRDCAAGVAHSLCVKYGDPLHNLQPRIIKTLVKAFRDSSKPMTTHYGAVVGLAAMGHLTVREVLVPALQPCLATLLPLLEKEDCSGSTQGQAAAGAAQKHGDANKLFGALQSAIAAALLTQDATWPPCGVTIDDVSLSQLRLQRRDNKTAIKANPPLHSPIPGRALLPNGSSAKNSSHSPTRADQPCVQTKDDRAASGAADEMDIDDKGNPSHDSGTGPDNGAASSRDQGEEGPQQSVSEDKRKGGHHAATEAAETFGNGILPYVPITGASKTFI